MQSHIIFSVDEVQHIAELSNIPVTEEEKKQLAEGFTTTMEVVDNLLKIETNNIDPTNQVTGLTNISREDSVDENRTFSQEEALRNAKRTHKGFFVVDQILDK